MLPRKSSIALALTAALLTASVSNAATGEHRSPLKKARAYIQGAMAATVFGLGLPHGVHAEDVVRESRDMNKPALKQASERHLSAPHMITPEEARKYMLTAAQESELRSAGLTDNQIAEAQLLSVFVGGFNDAHIKDLKEQAKAGELSDFFGGEDSPSDQDLENAERQQYYHVPVTANSKMTAVVHPSWSRDQKTGQYMEIFVSDEFGNDQYVKSNWVSTAIPGKGTPRGVFQVIALDKSHRSRSYGDSPMFGYFQLGELWGNHETPHETLLGCQASMGCIRMSRKDRIQNWALALKVLGLDVTNPNAKHIGKNEIAGKIVYYVLKDNEDYPGTPPEGVPPYIFYTEWNKQHVNKRGNPVGTTFPERYNRGDRGEALGSDTE